MSDISQLFIASYGRDDELGTKLGLINLACPQGNECQIIFRVLVRKDSLNGDMIEFHDILSWQYSKDHWRTFGSFRNVHDWP